MCCISDLLFFFFNDTATTEIYTLSLHDALPISFVAKTASSALAKLRARIHSNTRSIIRRPRPPSRQPSWIRSEEHTSELQSQSNLVCRLLLEKKKHRASPPALADRLTAAEARRL